MKYLENFRKNLERTCKENTILVFQEKHGDRYFLADTPERTKKAFLKILEERYNRGGYFLKLEDCFSEEDLLLARDSDEYIQKLQKTIADKDAVDVIKDHALHELDRVKKLVRYYKEVVFENGEIQKALSNKDGLLAFCILDGRRDYEYERFSFEHLESVEG